MAFIRVTFSAPVAHVRVSRKILSTDTISSTSMRVHKTSLKNDRLQITVVVSLNSRTLLINLVKLQVFSKMFNLRSFKSKWSVKISKHLLFINSQKDILIILIPKYKLGGGLEIRNHD
jgi:hypothetical protein